MENKTVTRRRALHVIGMTTGGLVLIGCQQGEKGVPKKKEMKEAAAAAKKAPAAAASAPAAAAAAAGDDGCGGAIDDKSKNLRSTLQYVEKSTTEGKNCSNCLQYKAPAAGKKCGGCNLFSGPVQPNGYCLSWAAKPA